MAYPDYGPLGGKNCHLSVIHLVYDENHYLRVTSFARPKEGERHTHNIKHLKDRILKKKNKCFFVQFYVNFIEWACAFEILKREGHQLRVRETYMLCKMIMVSDCTILPYGRMALKCKALYNARRS